MEQAAQVASNMSIDPLKEPRGFIKFIELIIAIFAFATTTSHSTSSKFEITCGTDGTPTQYSFSYSYAYNLGSISLGPYCNSTEIFHPYGNFSPPSQFYVFVGVMAFLYSIAALVLYVFFDEKYRKFDQIPIADFVISVVFTLLWLISSSAWAQGVTDVKYYTSPDELFEDMLSSICSVTTNTCKTISGGNFASLNVSLIFGFLNMGVWGANLWFLFKETKWFKVRSAPSSVPTPSEQPQKV